MIKKTTDRRIFIGCYSNKEAERLKEMLAQRLRQTCGVSSIQNARDCLTVERASIERNVWWEIHLAPKSQRPVKKFDLTRGMMREFLRGAVQGERAAKKAARKG